MGDQQDYMIINYYIIVCWAALHCAVLKCCEFLCCVVLLYLFDARGAYLIFGLSGWALIRGGRLFKVGAYSR